MPGGADFLQLDPAAAGPRGLADWLTGEIRDAIADGRLTAGARLPATRMLATQLGCSRGVVVEAYRRLADEGIVAGHGGGGTRVATGAVSTFGQPAHEKYARAAEPHVIDLRPGLPDLSAFPRDAWLRAERAALAELPAAALGYNDPRGTPALRTALAGWLGRTRGLRVGPDEIVVVNGVGQGLALIAQVLRSRGVRAVGVEDPGSRGTRDQVTNWGIRVVQIPVDEEGVDVATLAGTGVRAVLTTPAHQYPTGVVLSPGRRRALVAWARAGGLVIEDDYDAEHRYDRPPVAALHRMAPDRIAHVGSVSKTLAPALRLGWAIVPPNLRDELVERKKWSDISSPALGQLALAGLITSGGFERHLRAIRARQRQRRDTLLEALARDLPSARVHGVAASLHLMLTLHEDRDDTELARAARAAGVAVDPLSRHRILPGRPGFVVGYAATTPDRLREGVRRLAGSITATR